MVSTYIKPSGEAIRTNEGGTKKFTSIRKPWINEKGRPYIRFLFMMNMVCFGSKGSLEPTLKGGSTHPRTQGKGLEVEMLVGI